MASIGSLIVEFEARTGKFETDTGRAARTMEKRAKQINDQLAKIAKAAALAAVAAGAALATMAKRAIDSADKFSKMSQVTGVSTESLSQLKHAAGLAGLEFEELTTGITKLSRTAAEASRGQKAQARSFEALGISVANADGSLRNSEELLLDIAERFSQYEDGAGKAALAQELFGRAGAKMIPFLNQGRDGIEALKKEADALGLTVGGEAAKAAEQFNDNLTRLKSSLIGIVNQAILPLLPLLAKFSDEAVESAKNSDELARSAERVRTFFKLMASAAIIVRSVFLSLGKIIGGVVAASARLGEGIGTKEALFPILGLKKMAENSSAAGGIIADAFNDAVSHTTDDIERLDQIWSEASESIVKSAQDADQKLKKTLLFNPEDDSAKKAAEAAEKARDSIRGTVEDLQQQIATFGQGELATLKYSLAHGELAEQFEKAGPEAQKYRQILLDSTIQLEGMAAHAEMAAKKLQDFKDTMADGAAVIEATRTPLEKYNDEIERLNKLRDAGALGANQEVVYKRAVEAAQDAFHKASQDSDKFSEQFKDGVFRSLGDGIYTAMTDGAKRGWKGFLEAGIDTINRLVAQALAKRLAEGLFGGGKGDPNASGGGFLATAGKFLGNIFGGGRASGGPVSAGTLYRINEREPEFFRPNTGGQVVPLSKMSGGVTRVTQNIMVQGRADLRTARQMQIEAGRQQRIAAARLG